MRTSSLGRLILATSAMLGLLAVEPWVSATWSEEGGDSPSADYVFSSDPDVVVLSMTVTGGRSMESVSYSLRGDGILERTWGSLESSRKVEELSYLEMDDLVRTAVEGGLIRLDWPTLEKKIRDHNNGYVPSLKDTGRLTFTFDLESFSSAVYEEGPVHSTFTCVCIPAYLNRQLPEIREVRALHDLAEKLKSSFDDE